MFPTSYTIVEGHTFTFTENHTGLAMPTPLARNCTVFLIVIINKLRIVYQIDGDLGILCQVWCLIVSIPEFCHFSYFNME